MGSILSVKKMVARGLAAMKGTCVLHRSVSAWTSTWYVFSLLTRSQHLESSETFGPPKNITELKKTTHEVPRVQGYSVKKRVPWWIRGFARVEVFAWSGGPRCRKGGWMLMHDPIYPGKQVDIPWYTPKKEATKNNQWYPWTCLPNIHIQNKVVTLFFCWPDKLSDATLRIWQTPHHLPCLGNYPSCLEVACVLESQERDEQVQWGRQARCRMHRKEVFFLWG